jgi:hypothetical protein
MNPTPVYGESCGDRWPVIQECKPERAEHHQQPARRHELPPFPASQKHRDKRDIQQTTYADCADDEACFARPSEIMLAKNNADIGHDPVEGDAFEKHGRVTEDGFRISEHEPVIRPDQPHTETLFAFAS